MKFLFIITVATLIVLPCANALSNASTTNSNSGAISGNPVLVRGKGFEITRSDLDHVLATAKARYPQEELPPDAEVNALTQLIEIQLVLQNATDAEKAEGKRNADEKVADILKTMGAAEVEHRLKITRMTEDDLRLKLAQEATAQASLTRQLGIHVTDADAKKFFDAHPGAYDQPAMARVRELLLSTTSDYLTSSAPPLPASTVQAQHTLIGELLKRICAGEDFVALAKQYDEDPISKNNGGEFTFIREQMEFGDLAFSMRPDQISDVLTNQDGYRIFQLLEIIPAKTAVFDAVAGQVKNGLIGREKRRMAPVYIKQLWKEADVEIPDEKLRAAMAAHEAELVADVKKAAEAEAVAIAEANSLAQKAAEAKVFGTVTNQPPATP